MKKRLSVLVLLGGLTPLFAFAQSVDYSKVGKEMKKYQYFTDYQLSVIRKQQEQEMLNARQAASNPINQAKAAQKSVAQPKTKYVTPSSKNAGKNDYAHLMKNASALQGCWDKAGETYGLDPWLLVAIAKVESSFNNKAINAANRNKTVDYGMMQINSIWLPSLKKMGITKDDLFHPCTSVFVGAWIAKQGILKFGYNAQGIGAYNAGMGNSSVRVGLRNKYAEKVFAAYNKLVRDFHPQLITQN